jgi:perosamine synthetase
MTDVADIVAAIRSVVGSGQHSLHEPSFEGREVEYLNHCISTTMVSYVGSYVDRFETELSNFVGAKHCFCTNSGTAALHLALLAVGVSTNDEVLTPSFSFVATANAIRYCGGIPHFIDIDQESLGVNSKKLEAYLDDIVEVVDGVSVNRLTGNVLKAAVVVHTFGQPADISRILQLAGKFNIPVVEDAAEALGTHYFGKHVGTIADIGIFSFNGNKIITTGGGGAVVTNDELLSKKVRHIGSTAKVNHSFELIHDDVGFNYRMPNVNAAIGIAQLEKIKQKIQFKRRLFQRYSNAFSKLEEVHIFQERCYAESNYWLQVLFLNQKNLHFRDEILRSCIKDGLLVRPAWTPTHKLKPYDSFPKMDLTVTEKIATSIINLPSSSSLIND